MCDEGADARTWLARVRQALVAARAEGSLQPLPSAVEELRWGTLGARVHRITRFTQKVRGTREQDPFLPPYRDALFVGDLAPAHAVLLNKFPVLDEHVLLVTRAFLDQEFAPDPADLAALAALRAEYPGLAFYNGGRAAGASQPHRHLQVVSWDAVGALPFGDVIRASAAAGVIADWPVRHAIAPGGPADPSAHLRLRELFVRVGRDPDAPGPHNVVWGPDWTLVVPRVVASVHGIPVNALAYVGLLAVKDEEQLGRLRREGPWPTLCAAGERIRR